MAEKGIQSYVHFDSWDTLKLNLQFSSFTFGVNYVQFNLNHLSDLYKGSRVIIGGDINSLKICRLLQLYPDMKNLVADPTHGSKVLDVIITDAYGDYDRAVIGPIGPDKKGYGAPSDHSVAIARPMANAGKRTSLSCYAWRSRRIMTANSLLALSLYLATSVQYLWGG